MKKPILLSFFLIIFSLNSFRQISFSHSLGLGLYVNTSTGGFAAVYSPRLNLLNFNDNATISIGTHLGVGFSGTVSSQTGSSGSLVLDAPLVIELNVGHACTTESSHAFGFYLGFGLGYNSMSYVDDEGNVGTSTAGLMLDGGIRTNIIKDKSLDLRVSYLVDASGLTSGVFGFGLAYTFGMETY